MGMPILTPDLFAFLNVNRNYLPELPFRLVATCHAIGISQAGDVFETNPLRITVQFVDVSECCTSTGNESPPGFQQGPGTGGSFDSFGGSSGDDSGGVVTEGGVTAEGQIDAAEGEEGDSAVSDDDFVIE